MGTMDETLNRLLAESEIRKQLTNYCRSMDRCDMALGKAVFHPGTQVDYGTMYQGSAEGFVENTLRQHESARNHLHRISNITIEVNGDRAGSETYVDGRFRFEWEGKLIALYTRGRYIDRWEKRDGRWAISHRTYVHEMDGQSEAGDERYAFAGKRDPSDVSYAALGETAGA
jgi:SnoaL-like protein